MPRDRSPDDESADKPSDRRPSKPSSSGGKGRLLNEEQGRSLMNQIVGLTTQFTSGAMDLAKSGKYNPLAIGDKWVKYAYRKNLDPARLQAMTEAGHLLRDAREVAGINVADLPVQGRQCRSRRDLSIEQGNHRVRHGYRDPEMARPLRHRARTVNALSDMTQSRRDLCQGLSGCQTQAHLAVTR